MLNWIISSSVLIAIVLLLRLVLKGRVSQRLQYALWIPVLLRLLLPFSIGSSSLSILNTLPKEPPPAQIQMEEVPQANLPIQMGTEAPVLTPQAQPSLAPSAPKEAFDWNQALLVSYGTGVILVAAFFLYLNLQLSVRLRRSRTQLSYEKGSLPVYLSTAVETPCLFGLFRPAVYVTEEATGSPASLEHCTIHEQTHYSHGDHLWSLLRGLCLALHWYNPLVWVAAILSGRDAELACAEATLRRLGEEQRAPYARTLIALSCKRSHTLSLVATTMTGGKGSLKERIARIAKKPKMALYTPIVLLLVCALAVGCTFSNAKDDPVTESPATESTDPTTETPTESTEPTGPSETTQPPTPAAAPAPLADMTATLQWPPSKIYTTYPVSEGHASSFHRILMGYYWTPVEEGPENEHHLLMVINREATYGTVICHLDDTGILEYRTGEKSYYWRMEESGEALSVSQFQQQVQNIYYNLESENTTFVRPFPLDVDGNADAAFKMLVETVYPQPYFELSSGNDHGMTDYKLIDWEIRERSDDGTAATGYFRYAFVRSSDLGPVGGQDYGTGEYEGMIVEGWYVSIVLLDDGLWHYIFSNEPLALGELPFAQ